MRMKSVDKLILMLLPTVLQLPQLAFHYRVPISLKGVSLGLVLVVLIVRSMTLISTSMNLGSFRVGVTEKFFRRDTFFFVLFFSLLLLAAFRALESTEIALSVSLVNLGYLVMTILLGASFFVIARQPLSWSDRVKYFSSGFLFYIVFNFILYLIDSSLGFSPDITTESGENKTLGLLGLDVRRAYFPLAYGINAYGSVAAVGIICSFYLWYGAHRSKVRFLYMAMVFVAVFSLLLVESRGAIIALAITGALSFIGNIRFSRTVVLISPLMPLVIFGSVAILQIFGVLDLLSRGGSDFSGLVTDRDVIWGTALSELASFKFQHLFGFGLYGNVESGLMDKYYWLFEYSDEAFHSLHNYGLQYIIDIGYLGFLALMATLISAFRRAALIKDIKQATVGRFLISALIFLLYQGGTEAVPTVYSQECFLLFVFCLFAIFGFKGEKRFLYGSFASSR